MDDLIPSPMQTLSPEQMAAKATNDAFVKEYQELCKKHGRAWRAGIQNREPNGIFPIMLLVHHEPKKDEKTV